MTALVSRQIYTLSGIYFRSVKVLHHGARVHTFGRTRTQLSTCICSQTLFRLKRANRLHVLNLQSKNFDSRFYAKRFFGSSMVLSAQNSKVTDEELIELEELAKIDPEYKELLNEIKSDFKKLENENNGNEDTVTIKDSSSSESDSSEEVEYEEYDEDVTYEWVEEERTAPIPLDRGKTGVFDLEELVTVLRDENAREICVIEVPEHLRYVNYMIIASAISIRHAKAMAENIKWLHKQKKIQRDKFLRVEGNQVSNPTWIAMDLGNMALHLFMPEAREYYDLETLWTCGEKYDSKSTEEIDPYLMYPTADLSLDTAKLNSEHIYITEETVRQPEVESFESKVYHPESQEEALKPPPSV